MHTFPRGVRILSMRGDFFFFFFILHGGETPRWENRVVVVLSSTDRGHETNIVLNLVAIHMGGWKRNFSFFFLLPPS